MKKRSPLLFWVERNLLALCALRHFTVAADGYIEQVSKSRPGVHSVILPA